MRVCVCVDGTSISENAFDYYHRNLYREEHELLLVHLVRQVDLGIGGPSKANLANVIQKLQKAEDDAKEAQEKFEAHIVQHKLKIVDFVIKPASNKPGQTIIDLAVENQCQLIVSGTRGLDYQKRLELGSVSDYLVRKESDILESPVVLNKFIVGIKFSNRRLSLITTVTGSSHGLS